MASVRITVTDDEGTVHDIETIHGITAEDFLDQAGMIGIWLDDFGFYQCDSCHEWHAGTGNEQPEGDLFCDTCNQKAFLRRCRDASHNS